MSKIETTTFSFAFNVFFNLAIATVMLSASSYADSDLNPVAVVSRLQSGNSKDRADAANDLSLLIVTHHVAALKNNPVIVDQLIAQAQIEKDHQILDHIISTLTAIGDKKAYPVVLSIAAQADEASSRRMAIRAMRVLGGVEAIPSLKNIMANDRDTAVRLVAAEELGKLNDDAGFDFSMEMIKNENEFIRRDAAVALGAIGREDAVIALQKLSNSSEVGSGAASKALLDIQFKHLNSAQEKLQFLKRSFYGDGPAPGWTARQLAMMKTEQSLQLLLDTARMPAKVGTREYFAKESANEMFESLFQDGTAQGLQNIQLMKRTGILQNLPN